MLVSQWDFDGDAKDSVGSNDGELIGAPSFGAPLVTSEPDGQSIVLNGTSQAVAVPDDPSLRLSGSYWLTVWAERGSDEGTQILVRKGSSYTLYMNPGSGLALEQEDGEGGESALFASTDIVQGRYYRIDAVHDAVAETLSFYVNGRLVKSGAATTGPNGSNTSPLNIGARVANEDRWWNGRLDKVRIRNSAGSPAEVLAEYREESETIFSEGFETGDLSLFAEQQLSGEGAALAAVEADPSPFAGSFAMKATLAGEGDRAEVIPGHVVFSQGEEVYFRDRVWIPEVFPVSELFAIVWQLHASATEGSPPVALYIEDGRWRLRGGPDAEAELPEVVFWEGPEVATGRWVDIVVRVVFSEDPEQGKVGVWLDGVEQVLAEDTAQTVGAGDHAYPKWGAYRHSAITGDTFVGHDAIALSRSIPFAAPVAVTGAATSVKAAAATLNGSVDPNGRPTTYHFEYGPVEPRGAQRENLISNPSFEVDISTEWTSAGTPSSRERVTSEHHDGVASQKVVANEPNEGAVTVPSMATDPSQTYTASAYVKAPAGTKVLIRLEERTAADAEVGLTVGEVTASGGWDRVSASRAFGETGAKARVRVIAASAVTFYFDAVLLEQAASVGTYFPTPNQLATGEAAWSGAAHASSSTLTPFAAYTDKAPVGEDGDAGEGSEAVAVAESIGGLKPLTTYHFRLVAVNADGESVGEDATFATEKAQRIAVTQEYPPDKLAWSIRPPGGAPNRWAEDGPDPANVISDIELVSEMQGGYKEAKGTLGRDPRFDWPDQAPYADASVYGPGVEEVWAGRHEKAPEVSGDQMRVGEECAGWQTALENDKAALIGVIDRDLSKWGDPSTQRRLNLNAATLTEASSTVDVGRQDQGSAPPGIAMTLDLNETALHMAERWYHGDGVDIGKLRYDLIAQEGAEEAWVDTALIAADDVASAVDSSIDYNGQTALNQTVSATATGRKYAYVTTRRGGGFGKTTLHTHIWRVAVIGDHDLQERGTWPDIGFTASQILGWAIPKFARPLQIDPERLEDDGFGIPQAWWGATSMAAVVDEVTRYGLYDWFIYEDKIFQLRKPGSYGRTWMATLEQAGLQEEGLDAQRLWRDIVVRWQDVDGSTRTAGPPGSGAWLETPALQITDPDHPAVKADEPRRDMLELDGVSEAETAVAVGAGWLKEANLLSRAGTATLSGYVMDDKAVMRPASQVKAGDHLIVTNASDRSPRKIVQCTYNHPSRSAQVALDAPPEQIKALLERFRVRRVALGIG